MAGQRNWGGHNDYRWAAEGSVLLGATGEPVNLVGDVAINGAPVLSTNVIVTGDLSAASVDRYLFTADRAYHVETLSEVHVVAGTDTGAVTLTVTKCTGTQAPSAGAIVTATAFNLKSTAATVVNKTGAGTAATLAAGDRLGFDFTGVLTGLAGGVVTIALKPV